MNALRIAIVYTITEPRVDGRRLKQVAPEADATLHAIGRALREGGHEVRFVPAGLDLPQRLAAHPVDLVFNLSTGVGGGSHQTLVPAMLEAMGIPFTGSDSVAHALALDKARTKAVVAYHGVPTLPFQVMVTGEEPLDPAIGFPAIVKPLREGSSIGIDAGAIVEDEGALRQRVCWVRATLNEPALVERYITGREFTVGVVGNGVRLEVLPILERVFVGEGPAFEPVPEHADWIRRECPARLDEATAARLADLSRRAFQALGCADYARLDWMLDGDGETGEVVLLEVNSLPGLKPGYSDLPVMARAAGWGYEGLIRRIVAEAAARHGLALALASEANLSPGEERRRA